MRKININFGNLIQELKDKNLKMFVKKYNGNCIFIEDIKGIIYQIESFYAGSYLDKLMEEGIIVNFQEMDLTYYNTIEEKNKKYWDVDYIENFIKRQEEINDRKWIIEDYYKVKNRQF
ncbi:TPA: hypothetical protein ACH354_002216 [Clostridium perfringens]